MKKSKPFKPPRASLKKQHDDFYATVNSIYDSAITHANVDEAKQHAAHARRCAEAVAYPEDAGKHLKTADEHRQQADHFAKLASDLDAQQLVLTSPTTKAGSKTIFEKDIALCVVHRTHHALSVQIADYIKSEDPLDELCRTCLVCMGPVSYLDLQSYQLTTLGDFV